MYGLKRILIGVLLTLPLLSYASLIPFTEKNCPLLETPKTVLLVHATWCSHCRAFIRVYENVSNLNKYKDWTFYQVIADDLDHICGIQIDGYPYTYKNNMKSVLRGNRSQRDLEYFLDQTK
ncbi:MAG TPA: thioredoxin family protein [Legionellaceae bacterium]|nr:thioredoxin family protein [Legionellaceae bacterium]